MYGYAAAGLPSDEAQAEGVKKWGQGVEEEQQAHKERDQQTHHLTHGPAHPPHSRQAVQPFRNYVSTIHYGPT